jgi:hypothetical protein
VSARTKALGAFSVPNRPAARSVDAAAVDSIAATVAGEPMATPPTPTDPTSSPLAPVVAAAPADEIASADEAHMASDGTAYRRRKGKGERVTLYLTPKLKRAAEMRCLRERRSLSEAVEAALAAWLRSTKTH